MEIKFSESILDDQNLRLLFACAHPSLAPKVQVVITLKYVINLRIEAIARALGMTTDGIDKLLARAKQKIKEEKILLEEPNRASLDLRIPIVHKVLYLIFNEGYKSSWGKEIFREELCEEALLMTRALIDSGIGNQETSALYALMLFNSARFNSRFGASGELIDLENQDRSLWNKDLIALAIDRLNKAKSSNLSNYHLEASIAWLHCTSPDFRSTNWKMIANLYSMQLQSNPNPFMELSYAFALYYADQKQKAFEILHALSHHPYLSQYYLLNSMLGKLYLLEGNKTKAKEYIRKAWSQTSFKLEKEFLENLIELD